MIYTVTLNPAIDQQLTVKELTFNQVLRAEQVHVDLGGKGFNVSRMLAELGEKSVAVGFIAGRNGQILQTGLEALGIETRFVSIHGETRTNISITTETYDKYIKVNQSGPEVSQAQLEELLDLVRSLSQAGDWWVISGSIPPGVPASVYAQIVTEVHASQAHTILDASGDALRLGLQARPTFVKPNAEEAAELTGLPLTSDDGVLEAARAIRALGAQNVLISAGKDGALLYDGKKALKALPPDIETRNPVGAGDSLVAGLAVKLAEGQSLETALTWGTACGAATASQVGTEVGPSTLIKSLLTQVTVEEVSDVVHS